jgi:hypothetical protein
MPKIDIDVGSRRPSEDASWCRDNGVIVEPGLKFVDVAKILNAAQGPQSAADSLLTELSRRFGCPSERCYEPGRRLAVVFQQSPSSKSLLDVEEIPANGSSN